MSKENILIVDLFIDLDETLVRNDCSSSDGSPIFNGATSPGVLGPSDTDFPGLPDFKGFAVIKDWMEYYKNKGVDVRIRVLTARPYIEESSLKIAKILNLKPRLKSTGQEFESKGEIYFAMHYPDYGKVFLFLDGEDLDLENETPCFVWQKKEGILTYCYSQNISVNLAFKPKEVEQVNALMSTSIQGGLLDEKKHEKLIQTIFKFAPVNRLITYSPSDTSNTYKITDTNLDESDIDPAYHFSHVPKAWIMEKIRNETPGNVLASILMDQTNCPLYHRNLPCPISCTPDLRIYILISNYVIKSKH